MKALIVSILFLSVGLSPAWAYQLPRSATAGSDRPVKVGLKPELPLGMPGGTLGYWGVGNGGDWLRIGFARARDYAAEIVMRIKPASLRRVPQADIRNWIIDNQKFLAADILQTEHIWDLEERPTCAWTLQPSGSDRVPTPYAVQLSYPSCRQNVDSFLKAAQILIHEAVHHFNGDETTADLVAIAIIDAWQSGLTDAIPLSLEQAPPASMRHASVWTGTEMIVIGGYQNETQESLASAGAYDPARESWRSIAWPTGFQPRHDAQVVWTGEEVLVWGGYGSPKAGQTTWLYDGALYRPATKTWTLLAAPSWWSPKATSWDADPRQSLIWTGSRAIVYGGIDAKTNLSLGAIFDGATRSWSPVNTRSPYAPQLIAGHSAVWTGKEMLVWGGYAGSDDFNREISQKGARYDPEGDTWSPLSEQGAPQARAGHQAVWTGQKMIVFSGGGVGSQGNLTATGGLYDPAQNSWLPLQTELLIERVGHKMLWNGEELLVVGGRSNRLKSYFGETYAFHPTSQKWRVVSTGAQVTPRFHPSLVWTGSSALLWGGMGADTRSLRSGQMILP